MKVGFIGTGNMGRILIEAFIKSELLLESDLYITNRTVQKALALKKLYPHMHVLSTPVEIANTCDLIFLCVKPLDILNVMKLINPFLNPQKWLVSITSPITPEQLEAYSGCMVARAVPSITNTVLSGTSLITFGPNCSTEFESKLITLFRGISSPRYIENGNIRIASDITSCGPAFISDLLVNVIDGAVNVGNLSPEVAVDLTTQMIIALGHLLESGVYTLPQLVEKVCVKGGITGEGIKVIHSQSEDLFTNVFKATHEKFQEDLAKVAEKLSEM